MDKKIQKNLPYNAELAKLYFEIERFNTRYSHSLNDGLLEEWANFFTQDAFYSITARENYDANLPVGLVYCQGKDMMEDRVFALQKTAMYAPRHMRHFISNLHIDNINDDGSIVAGANYILMQTLYDYPESTVHQVGKFVDEFVYESDMLLLRKRICVYDNLLVPNDLVLPV